MGSFGALRKFSEQSNINVRSAEGLVVKGDGRQWLRDGDCKKRSSVQRNVLRPT